jgi:hypothetical protein
LDGEKKQGAPKTQVSKGIYHPFIVKRIYWLS